jgi:hypothetical protein
MAPQLLRRANILWTESRPLMRALVQFGIWQPLKKRVNPKDVGNTASVRDVFLHQARSDPPNALAIQLLHLDKEWNNLRYFGISKYLQQKREGGSALPRISWLNSSSSSSNSLTSAIPRPQEPAKPSARIPFIITSSMKSRLEELGYLTEDLKTLTPLQATLLLEHQIAPSERMSQLPVLEQERAAQQQEQMDAVLRADELNSKTSELSIETGPSSTSDDPPPTLSASTWLHDVADKKDEQSKPIGQSLLSSSSSSLVPPASLWSSASQPWIQSKESTSKLGAPNVDSATNIARQGDVINDLDQPPPSKSDDSSATSASSEKSISDSR